MSIRDGETMKKIILLLFVLLSFALVSCDEVFKPLDKIHKYTITVDPNDDGTLDMVYYLKWEVLQEGDGGVDFITVGVANRFVEDIVGLTNNIDKIKYSSEDGATIRIDFKRTYHKGDIFEVEFSFRQKRIFSINNNKVEYSFNPGWFDEIQVDKLVVIWKDTKALNTNADEVAYNHYKWETSLDYGETIDVNLVYDKSHFPNLNPKEDYSAQTDSPWPILIFFAVIFILIVVVSAISLATEDKYQTSRGFSGRIHRVNIRFGRYRGYRRSGKVITRPKVINSSGSGVGSGGGCACACACACAGGGRAGCSRKDFNNYLNI